MLTGAQRLLHHVPRLLRWVLSLVAALLVAAGIAVAVDRTFFSVETRTCSAHATRSSRPDLQRILNGLVTGRSALAPGATAYVSGPHGSWLGAAGVADTSTCARMPVNARMRLESVTKIYTATLILQLAQAATLRVDDTVERWLPGLLPSYGNRITIRQLLTMTSGLIDNNDFMNASDSVRRTYLAHVKDAELRAQMLATIARANEDPAVVVSELLWIRWAAWQPLLFTPGSGYSHYSNIGYDILGLIAARAGGKPLAALYREQIFEPLGLHATAYDPQGPISGPHARGYGIDDGARFDTTDWHWGVGAEGGIVANARDTGAFLTALMRGKLLDRAQLTAMELENLWRGGESSGCDGQAYGWSGGGAGYKTDVWANDGGSRVAVLLVNARHHGPPQVLADAAVHHALASLYCSA